MSFKDDHRAFQELVRELRLVREHNRAQTLVTSQARLLLFAEAALVLVVLERFLRMILEPDAKDTDTLFNLLQMATSPKRNLLEWPAGASTDPVRIVTNVRNTIMHGNYEQAAREAKCRDVPEYFRTQFVAEIERLYELTNFFVRQIDGETGERYAK